jgi:NlpC/P60 family protein
MRRPILFALLLSQAASWRLAAQAPANSARPAKQQVSGQAAQAPRQQVLPAGVRPLNLREGRAIVQEMSWADDEEGLAPDCSHLVHHLYEQAGYPYPYASSLDLYRGMGQFLRVRMPQPGDLVVWRGHVGIVVNPREHSFFSSVTSGTRVEDYGSAYWRARGHPRFYRYLTSTPLRGGDKTLEAANRPPDPQLKAQADHPSPSNGKGDRAIHRQGDPVSDPPTLQAVKTTPAAAKPSKPYGEVAPTSAARTDNALQIPLRTGGHPPKAADVASALEAANLDAGEILRAGNLERLERPVMVYRNLQVSGVELKGKRGTAQIQFETMATISTERMESLLGREEHQLELQRIKKGWVMTPANETVCVPREGAMRILAARLASVTQSVERSTEKDREQAAIIRLLNLLIE